MGTYAITGGASGIGEATAALLRDQGHSAIVVDVLGGDVIADLGTRSGRGQAVSEIIEFAPAGLDGLVTCAAVHPDLGNNSVLEVNYHGTCQIVEGLYDSLKQCAGSAVLVSSHTSVLLANPELSDALLANDETKIAELTIDADPYTTYASVKRALMLWARRKTPAWAKQGVRLNVVVPGYTQTPMTEISQNNPEQQELIANFKAAIPLTGEACSPGETAAAILFFLSEGASFITGQFLFVDGGQDTVLRPDAEGF